jgi:prefoldin subunit 5
LGERDKAIQDMKEEKDDLEKSVESLRTALRQQEQSSGVIFWQLAQCIIAHSPQQINTRRRTGTSK